MKICFRFKIQEYLDLHIRNQHSESRLKPRQKNPCSICGKILSSHAALKNHEDRHVIANQPPEKVNKFFCDHCGKTFRLKSYLFNHFHNVHIRTKHICPDCSKGFYKRYELDDHIRQFHTMEKPFICDHEGCVKSFARKKNLLIHQRIHTGMNSKNQYMKNKFWFYFYLFSGVRPYSCSDCDKSFMHFIDRKRHMIKHVRKLFFLKKMSNVFIGFHFLDWSASI